MNVYIYGLIDPRNQQLRYIGVTKNPAARRRAHRRLQHTKDKRSSWITSLRKKGLKPEFFIIEETDEINWIDTEVFWINYFRYIGSDLLNMVAGGVGILNPTAEVRAKISAKAKGRIISEETRRKMSEGNKGRTVSEEECKKRSERVTRTWEQRSAEEKKRIWKKAGDAKRGRRWTDERKQERSELMKRKANDPSYHAQLAEMARKHGDASKGIPRSQDLKEKVSKTLTGRNLSEEHKRHIVEGRKKLYEQQIVSTSSG